MKPTGEKLEVLPDAAAHHWVHSNLTVMVKVASITVMAMMMKAVSVPDN